MVAITGSIGTGKSTVCKLLQQKGFEVINLDEISHKILDNESSKIAEIFGEEFLDKNGRPNRKKLAETIFTCKEKREKLEKLLHVKIFEYAKLQIEELEKKEKIYFLDIPLLYETKNRYNPTFTCVIYAPKEIEIKRVMLRDNASKIEAQRKIDTQIDIEFKRQKADFVIDNSKDKEHLLFEVELFLKKLREKYENCKI